MSRIAESQYNGQGNAAVEFLADAGGKDTATDADSEDRNSSAFADPFTTLEDEQTQSSADDKQRFEGQRGHLPNFEDLDR